MDGIISIIKPEGITSYDVIRVVKRTADEKKIGHIGTLDPMATGVLPLFLGKMTKLISHFNNGSKIYKVRAVLGAESTTLDREGEITPVPIPRSFSLAEIKELMDTFIGEIEQTPPIYSSIKVKGKKLYEYARAGKAVEIKSRKVIIHWIKNISYQEPELCFDVHCSKGTYIRALAKDVAGKLGTSAYLKTLERTQCGEFFRLNNSIHLDLVKKNDKAALLTNCIPPDSLMPNWHKIYIEDESIVNSLRQGKRIEVGEKDVIFFSNKERAVSTVVLNKKQQLIALGELEFSQGSLCIFQPSKVFV